MSFLAGPSKRQDAGGGGVPTYRHLLSPQAMTVSNPLRTIAHCDIDAAYAQFEQVRLGLPDNVPLICAQWQSIIAVNYPARKYGIKRFTTLDEARKLCPELIVQHVATYRNGENEAGYWGEVDPRTHKVSLDPYRRESLKILAIFKEMVPRGEIEKASIDEAFLDLTPMVIERMLTIHPYLATIPDDAPEGLDSPLPPAPHINWSKAGNVFPINGETDGEDTLYEELRSEDGQDEGEEERVRGSGGETWEDWALCIGAEIMRELREEVYRQLHYTCSAGVAHNKAMAKLCSAWKKPNNQTVLRHNAVAAFLREREFTDIRLLGGKLGNAMATEFDAKTVGDMLTVPLEEMQRRFGEESIWVYNIIRGIDHTEVVPRVSTKSMLASKNVRPNVTTPEQGQHWLSVLAGELNVRLREAREVAPGLWPKTLVLSHRQGIEPSRSRQTPFPFTKSLSTEYILKYAKKLWDEATQPMKNGNMKLNNIALSFTGLERLEEGQRGIEGFFTNSKPPQSSSAMTDRPNLPSTSSSSSSSTTTLPTLNSTIKRPLSPAHRSSSISSAGPGPSPKKPRLPTLHTGKRKTVLESFLAKKNGESSSASARSESPSISTPIIDMGDDNDDLSPTPESRPRLSTRTSKPEKQKPEVEVEEEQGSWRCPVCQAVLVAPAESGEERAKVLADLKQEHEDWHFALSLQDQDGPGTGGLARGGNQTTTTTSKVKKMKKPEGIKAFFTPRGT
ncbi:hypothetical protein IAR55_003551 [Kwoniella newhampshirensis]|uniref:DNA polymerase eta n=1 Tax=Kwoniella newhampshirensis TaxID=1651941 RepID=A0AAW0YYU7_9TREE